MKREQNEVETQFIYEIGKRLKAARIEAGLTQWEMGNSLIVTHQQIQKYEMGMNRLSIFKLAKWAVVTGKPLSYFYVGVDCE